MQYVDTHDMLMEDLPSNDSLSGNSKINYDFSTMDYIAKYIGNVILQTTPIILMLSTFEKTKLLLLFAAPHEI